MRSISRMWGKSGDTPYVTVRITKRADVGTLRTNTLRTDISTLTLLLVMLPVYALSLALTVLRCTVSVSYVEGSVKNCVESGGVVVLVI